MKFLFLSAFCALALFPGITHGKIGWTREKCIEKFKGEPVKQVAAKLVKSEGQADVFKTKIDDLPVSVRVEYRAGKVWMITYQGKGMRKNRAASLAAANAGDRKKMKERSFQRVQHWIDKENKIHAVYFVSPVQHLIVMNANSLKAEKKPGVSLILDPDVTTEDPGNPEDPDGEKKPEPVADPLEQFKCSMLKYNTCRIG
ncbi:MAG: hypothetical protein GY899_01010 [Verrucomicrobiaceae bacterium]|nr:hypothetical protein [Verrucomicrobiaceae bacterium]